MMRKMKESFLWITQMTLQTVIKYSSTFNEKHAGDDFRLDNLLPPPRVCSISECLLLCEFVSTTTEK